MNIRLTTFVFLAIFSLTSILAARSRRDVREARRIRRFYREKVMRSNVVSGSIPGTAYYGIGSDPNYGNFIRPQNRPNSGFRPISYDPTSNDFGAFINPSHTHQQMQQSYSSNNRWTGSRFNEQTRYQYPPGSPGWFATGGHYQNSNGYPLMAHSRVYFICALLWIITLSNLR